MKMCIGTGLGTGLGTTNQAKPAVGGFGQLGAGTLFQQPQQNNLLSRELYSDYRCSQEEVTISDSQILYCKLKLSINNTIDTR
jgi:hypothetical protein